MLLVAGLFGLHSNRPLVAPPVPAAKEPTTTKKPTKSYGFGFTPIGEQQYRSSDGRIYQRNVKGTLIRISPQRPWRGKSERRQVLLARRVQREADADLVRDYLLNHQES